MLELDKVSLNFQSSKGTFDHGVHHVLDSVSFKLYENETLGIIGRNGVGKTTMLRIMAGIIAPTSGTVRIKAGITFGIDTGGIANTIDGANNKNEKIINIFSPRYFVINIFSFHQVISPDRSLKVPMLLLFH